MHTHRSHRGQCVRVLVVALVAYGALLLSAPLASALMAGKGFMWSVAADAPVTLDVCWENPTDPGDTEARAWARLALKNSWERYARVVFTGWDECENEDTPISPPHTFGPRRPGTGDENLKIEIRTSGGGQNPAHGSWGDHQQSGVILNLYCGKSCVEHLAIHEIGHALGFYHGEERGDWVDPGGCPQQTYNPSYPWWPVAVEELRWGRPDVDSTMAYCSGTSVELSPVDIAGVRRAYERRLPGTVLSTVASQCLASHAASGNSDTAFGWECDEALDDQEWAYDTVNSALSIATPAQPANRFCLDVDTLDDTDVQIWQCHYGANQQWQFRRVQLRGYGGLCLTRPNAGPGTVTMETCTGTDAQLWRLEPGAYTGSIRIRAEATLLCLAAKSDNGASVVAETCDDAFHVYLPLVIRDPVRRAALEAAPPITPQGIGGGQNFYLAEGGQIRLPARIGGPQHCFDVQDVLDSDFQTGLGGPQPGQRVQSFTCLDAQLNQRWNLTGNIVSLEKCLTLSGDATSNGANAKVYRCDGSEEQEWDYYW